MLDLPLGSSQYKQLYEGITRLTSGVIHVTTHTRRRKGYLGHLIDSGLTDQETDPAKDPPDYYELQLNKSLSRLFGKNDWTALDWEQRKLIRDKPLTLGLHALYSSDRDPFPMKVETLYSLVGSETKEIKNKYRLKKALDELKEIGSLENYTIENELVNVCRLPLTIERKR